MFGLLQISIGLYIFRFVANEYQPIAMQLHSTIHNILSAIWWAITKIILNYLPLPTWVRYLSTHLFKTGRFGPGSIGYKVEGEGNDAPDEDNNLAKVS